MIRIDGHDIAAFCKAVEEARNTKGRPTLILADTIKGQGVSFLAGADRHGKAPSVEERDKAVTDKEQQWERLKERFPVGACIPCSTLGAYSLPHMYLPAMFWIG